MRKNKTSRFVDRVPIPSDLSMKGPAWGWIIVLCFIPPLWPVNVFLCVKKAHKALCRRKLADYRGYLAAIGNRIEIAVRELMSVSGKSEATVVADLQHMADKGYLGQSAYLDRGRGMLFIAAAEASVYEEEPPVRETGKRAAKQPAREAEAPRPAPKKSADRKTDLESFETILRRIRTLNEEIADEGVSAKIDRIGVLTSGIFGIVQMKPERKEDVARFLDYYLPTTFKLLEMYAMMERQGHRSRDMEASMRRIESSLDMLIAAFEKLQEKLFTPETLDVDTDIDVLRTVMIRDGLFTPENLDINEMRTQGGV